MKITMSQLKKIIKEELGAVSNAPRTADKFLDMIERQFQRAKSRATVENMAHYYDEMIAIAADSAPFGTEGPLEIADSLGLDRKNPYWSWARHHLQHLVELPKDVIDTLPPSAGFTPAALEKVSAEEERIATYRKDLESRDPKDFSDGAAAHHKK